MTSSCVWCQLEAGDCVHCGKKLDVAFFCVQPGDADATLRGFHVCQTCPSTIGKPKKKQSPRPARRKKKKPPPEDFSRFIPRDKRRRPPARAATPASFREKDD